MLRLGSRWTYFHSKSGVLFPMVLWADSRSPSFPRSRTGQDQGRETSTAHPALGSFTVQLLAGIHCPGVPLGWERKWINLSPKPWKGRGGWAEGCQGRNQGWRWEVRNWLCWFRELFTDISQGEGHVHSVFPVFAEMMEAWSREFCLKTKFTGIKSFWFLWWRLVSRPVRFTYISGL